MAKVGCEDCKGCSACCRDMGTSVALDPYDICRLTGGLGVTAQALLEQHILDFAVSDGVITPYLCMDAKRGCCSFLNEEGRCSIHPLRPSVCRCFPLGRIQTQEGIRYILQVNECKAKVKSKVRVDKWLDVFHYESYEEYLVRWYSFVKRLGEKVLKANNQELMGEWNTVALHLFVLKPYELPEGGLTAGWDQAFFAQFDARMKMAEKILFSEE